MTHTKHTICDRVHRFDGLDKASLCIAATFLIGTKCESHAPPDKARTLNDVRPSHAKQGVQDPRPDLCVCVCVSV